MKVETNNMTKVELILTVMADDQPGIVDKVSSIIAQHQGNWLESSLSKLAGKFAGIVRVECSLEQQTTISAALADLEQQGIRVTTDSATSLAVESEQQVTLQVTSNDRPGIVKEVSKALAGIGANVLKLETETESAAMSAGLLFSAVITVAIPASLKPEQLGEVLETLSDDLIVDYLD